MLLARFARHPRAPQQIGRSIPSDHTAYAPALAIYPVTVTCRPTTPHIRTSEVFFWLGEIFCKRGGSELSESVFGALLCDRDAQPRCAEFFPSQFQAPFSKTVP
jgi:hypothetical protein